MGESSRVGLALNINLEINSVSLFVWFNCGLGGSIQTGKSLGDFAGVCVYYGFPAEHPLSESNFVSWCKNSLALGYGTVTNGGSPAVLIYTSRGFSRCAKVN